VDPPRRARDAHLRAAARRKADRSAVGISGIDQRRFRGAIRFLEALARGTVRDRLKASGDPGLDQIAFGIAR
jgi:hypothetical protein